jgi:SAM-dependent methyltransferase
MSVAAKTFQRIYENNLWGFGSGHGSLPRVTKSYRLFIENFIREKQISSVVDFGCGDWQFSRFTDWSAAEYLGLDINAGVIDRNQSAHAKKGIRFALAPDRFSSVPSGELLLVKDVLQHFSTSQVEEFMSDVVSRFPFALITNCVKPAAELNREIETGGWRPLDLRAPPYSFDVPVVHSFGGAPVISFRKCRIYPAWRKNVLLFSNLPTGRRQR